MPRPRKHWKSALAAGSLALSALGAIELLKRSPSSLGRVALIGDSYAVGLGPQLERLISDFRYEGHVGTNTWQWAHHSGCGECGSWLASFKPRMVLVSLGVNDGNAPNPVNYQTIVRMIHGIGAHVIWIEPPAQVITSSREVIASLGVATVPATTLPLGADHLHPTSYEQWANEVASVSRELMS